MAETDKDSRLFRPNADVKLVTSSGESGYQLKKAGIAYEIPLLSGISNHVNYRLPSYALPTVASRLRVSLSTDKLSSDELPVCNRYRPPSPALCFTKGHRSQSVDNGLKRSQTEHHRISDRMYTPRCCKDGVTGRNKSNASTPASIRTPPQLSSPQKTSSSCKSSFLRSSRREENEKPARKKEKEIVCKSDREVITPPAVESSKDKTSKRKHLNSIKNPKKEPNVESLSLNREITNTVSCVISTSDSTATSDVIVLSDSSLEKSKSIERAAEPIVEKMEEVNVASAKLEPMKSKAADPAVDEYRAKLAEKRRLAREKAEREADEERMRLQMAKEEEERKQRHEEEEERRREEEELRLAEESRKAEEERFHKMVEMEEKRKKEEAEQMEAELKAKMEQERLAIEEAKRLEQERQAKINREEEEKLERKKRLENVMKRVKADETSPTKKTGSGLIQPEDGSSKDEILTCLTKSEEDAALPPPPPPSSTVDDNDRQQIPFEPKFKSPLLQQMLTGKLKKKLPDDDEPTNSMSDTKKPEAINGITKEMAGLDSITECSSVTSGECQMVLSM